MSVSLRPNRILQKLRQGEVVSCTKLNLSDPRVVEIAALAGFDCVWLDTEHVPNSVRDIEHGVRAAQAYGIDAIVRVPRGSYSDLIRPLEMDAAGIMVPHVMSAEDARGIARQTRFHPIGMRALDGGNADGAYCRVDLKTYLDHANTHKLVIAQIEDPQAVEALDDIAQVEGIDMLFFGPATTATRWACRASSTIRGSPKHANASPRPQPATASSPAPSAAPRPWTNSPPWVTASSAPAPMSSA